MTCVEEHEAYQDDPYLGCHSNREYFKMPSEYRIFPQASTSTGHNNNNDDDDDGDSSDDEYFDCDAAGRRVENSDDEDGESKSVDSDKSLLETFETRNSSNNSREFGGAGDNGRPHKGRESSGRTSGISQGRITRSSSVVQRTTTRSAAAARQQQQNKLRAQG